MATTSSNADGREGRLLATLINVLVAGLSDPSRLGRGRTYARQGAVDDLGVHPGIITGSVQGSRSAPYEVVVHVAAADSFDTMSALVPARRDIRFSCTCPDWDDPCKHSVAVMVAFAELVSAEPALLGLLRGDSAPNSAGRAVVGSRTAVPGTASPSPVAETRLDETQLADLLAYLGEPTDHPPATVSPLGSPAAAWGELWAEMLDDALRALTDRQLPTR